MHVPHLPCRGDWGIDVVRGTHPERMHVHHLPSHRDGSIDVAEGTRPEGMHVPHLPPRGDWGIKVAEVSFLEKVCITEGVGRNNKRAEKEHFS